MFAIFAIFPLVMLLILDGSALAARSRRKELLAGGIPVTAEITRIDVVVTRKTSPPNGDGISSTSRSTRIRPIVRFATEDGQLVTTSPIRSGANKRLIAGQRVNLRYSPTKPSRCMIDEPNDANQGRAATIALLVIMNVILIGFIVFALKMNDAATALTPIPMPTFIVPGAQ